MHNGCVHPPGTLNRLQFYWENCAAKEAVTYSSLFDVLTLFRKLRDEKDIILNPVFKIKNFDIMLSNHFYLFNIYKLDFFHGLTFSSQV